MHVCVSLREFRCTMHTQVSWKPEGIGFPGFGTEGDVSCLMLALGAGLGCPVIAVALLSMESSLQSQKEFISEKEFYSFASLCLQPVYENV